MPEILMQVMKAVPENTMYIILQTNMAHIEPLNIRYWTQIAHPNDTPLKLDSSSNIHPFG
ncbi:unnamed protein product [Callosobruchus maculatus]|uniref:Uncharacterized protein n=1 Tax=Callosobruchus maculatus TaxID=64391 RepID=A0A653CAV1_CALMS|nr:unnamed protein product [Callosobruchus maculatus]